MGFEPDQPQSHVESVNEFKDQMKDTLEEAKAALAKSKDDMTLYYNRKWSPAPEFKTGDIVRGCSASSDVSSDISPSPLYIPPHCR